MSPISPFLLKKPLLMFNSRWDIKVLEYLYSTTYLLSSLVYVEIIQMF